LQIGGGHDVREDGRSLLEQRRDIRITLREMGEHQEARLRVAGQSGRVSGGEVPPGTGKTFIAVAKVDSQTARSTPEASSTVAGQMPVSMTNAML
jgi:hypothetical protein